MRQQRQQKRHRYVLEEPHIPFEYGVLYENDAIIVVDKPHFLATTPRGMWYRETALIRLREQYGEPDIVPAHRLDRLTAGIVVFVRKPELRGAYQMLFQNRKPSKPMNVWRHLPSNSIRSTNNRVRIDRHQLFRRSEHRIFARSRAASGVRKSETINAQTLIERGSTVRCIDGKAYVNYKVTRKPAKRTSCVCI